MQRTFRLAVLALAAVLTLPLSAAETETPRHHQEHTFKSADAGHLWTELMDGNRRYVAGHLFYNTLRERRRATADHQNPPVAIVSCSDSRVPPELIFDRTVGDLFVVRVAGNVADSFGMASLEYAIAKGYTKLIVVIGHESCGAVIAALEKTIFESPYLTALVDRIRESFVISKPHDTRQAVEANARFTAEYLTAHSPIIDDAVKAGKVKIMSAYYSFDGHITPLSPVPAH